MSHATVLFDSHVTRADVRMSLTLSFDFLPSPRRKGPRNDLGLSQLLGRVERKDDGWLRTHATWIYYGIEYERDFRICALRCLAWVSVDWRPLWRVWVHEHTFRPLSLGFGQVIRTRRCLSFFREVDLCKPRRQRFEFTQELDGRRDIWCVIFWDHSKYLTRVY